MPGGDVDGLLRSGVASLCLAAGVLHMSAAADHRGMAGHVAFFLIVAAVQSALAAGVLWGGRRRPWLVGAAAVNLAVAAVWVLSRTTGLPVDGSSVPEAIGFKDGISTLLEIGAVAGAGFWWLLPEASRSVALSSRRLASALLGTGVWALGASGLFAGHTHSAGHAHEGRHPHGAAHAHGAQTVTAGPESVGAEHTHGGIPVPHGDHANSPKSTVAAGAPPDGHFHEGAVETSAHDAAGHHHAPDVRLAAGAPASAHGHGGQSQSHSHGESKGPVPTESSGHRHPDAATDSGAHGEPGHDHDRQGEGHDHDGGHSGDDHDEDGGTSALEDLLKLIQPR
jgi:hypothetical protein